jgi:hypothetical protein
MSFFNICYLQSLGQKQRERELVLAEHANM